MKKQHIFAETCLYEAVGNLSVMNAFTAPSCSLREKSSFPRLVNVSVRSEKQQYFFIYFRSMLYNISADLFHCDV